MAIQIGPKIGIDGEKEYRDALKQIINETKNLDAAMQKTASEWTSNTSAMTKAKAVAENLVQRISAQEQAIATYNTMLEKCTEKYGENAAATKSWQRALDTATASLNEMKNDLQSFNGAENFSELSTKIADIGTSMQNTGAKMAAIGGALTFAITRPLKEAGGAAVGLASDMTEASSKVDVIFGGMSESVKSFADTSLEAYGVSNVKAMEMLGTFGAMATEMGISDRAAAEMATTLTGLSGDLAAFHNSEIEVTQTALEGIFTGQTRALTQFAGAINQANLEEFAAKQGKVYSQMTEGEKVMTRYQLVLERTQDAQGNFAATGGETAGSIQKFKGAVEQLGVAFGEQLLPIITPIIQALTKFIQFLTELPAPVQKVIVVIAAFAAAIGPVILVLGTLMASFGSIVTNAPRVASAFVKIGEGAAYLAAMLGVTVPELLLIVAALAACVAIGYEVAKHWDDISAAAENMANSFTGAVDKLDSLKAALADLAMDMARNLLDKIKELPEKIANELRQAIAKIKEVFSQMIADAKKSGKDMVDGFIEGIKSKISKVVEAVKKVANTVKEFLGFSEPEKGPLSNFHTFAPDMMKLFAQGINQNKGIVTRALDSLAKEIALPLDTSASMNMAIAGVDGGYSLDSIGGTTVNVYVDHINDLQDLINIQNQAQQRYRMGAR